MKSTFAINNLLIQSLFFLLMLFSIGSAAQQAEQSFTTAYRYDLKGRVTGIIKSDPDGSGPLRLAAIRNTYHTNGLLASVETGELSVWLNEYYRPADWGSFFTITVTKGYEYDNFGRKTKEYIRGANGIIESLIQISYNSQGLVFCKAVRMNKNAYSSLPASACTQSALGSEGPDRITRYTYDTLDQITQEERGIGTTLTQVYGKHLTNSTLPTIPFFN